MSDQVQSRTDGTEPKSTTAGSLEPIEHLIEENLGTTLSAGLIKAAVRLPISREVSGIRRDQQQGIQEP
jgi:hypothetical protein